MVVFVFNTAGDVDRIVCDVLKIKVIYTERSLEVFAGPVSTAVFLLH